MHEYYSNFFNLNNHNWANEIAHQVKCCASLPTEVQSQEQTVEDEIAHQVNLPTEVQSQKQTMEDEIAKGAL